jgi:type VI secretion system secreted protein VgrG
MGLFDDVEDPLSEIGEVLEDLGVPGASDTMNDITRTVQAAIDANGGVPDPTMRFLVEPIDWSKKPTSSEDTGDIVAQAGQILDNLGGGGYGQMGAALLNNELGLNSYNEQSAYWVLDMTVTEGLSRTWRCELTLGQPIKSAVTAVNPKDLSDELANAWMFDKTNSASGLGLPGAIIQDVQEGVGWMSSRLADPYGTAQEFADQQDPTGQGRSTDPDALDPTKLPDVHDQPVDPELFLGKFCRVSINRRIGANRFTLSERWFSGVCVEFEDVGFQGPTMRVIKLVIVPRFQLLSMRRRYRAWQGKNAVEIALAILEEHGVYKRDAGDTDTHALRLEPGGADLFGPVGVPDALTSAVDSIGDAIPGGSAVTDAVNSVLEKDIEDWTEKREYCVQYGESDLEFIERLLAEEGITYFFEHTERRETLVLADDPFLAGRKTLTAARVPLPGTAVRPNDAVFRQLERAWNVSVGRSLVASSVTMRDRNYTRPYEPTDLKAGESLDMLAPGGLSSLTTLGGLEQMANQAMALGAEAAGTPGAEDYAGPEATYFDYPAEIPYQPEEGETGAYDAYGGPPLAEQRLQAFRAKGAIARVASSCTSLMPGNNVTITGIGFDRLHMPTGQPQKLLVTFIRHTITRQNQIYVYQNTFEGINSQVRYRPAPPASRPRIHGVQTAIIIDTAAGHDPANNAAEVHIDKSWRVKVRFPWDRGEKDKPASSCWLRFGQHFSGAGFGTVLAPRVGMEAIVGFDEGNPDRPHVLGALYNGPFESGEHTRHPSRPKQTNVDTSRIHQPHRKIDQVMYSRSWPQGVETARANRLTLHDHGTHEAIEIHAQQDFFEEVGKDRVTSVLGDQSNDVTGEQVEEVKGDQTLHVHYKSDGEEDHGRKIESAEELVEIGGGSKDKPQAGIGGLASYLIEKNHYEEVKGKRTTEVGSIGEELLVEGTGAARPDKPARDLRVKKNQTIVINGNEKLTVTGNRDIKVGKAHNVTASEVKMVAAGANPSSGAPPAGGLTIGPEGAKAESSGRIRVSAEDLEIKSEGDAVVFKSKTKLWLHGGESSVLLVAAEKTCVLSAEPAGSLKIGTEGTNLTMTDTKIQWMAGGQARWEVRVENNEVVSEIKDVAKVTFEGKEQVHINSAQVRLNG